MAFIRSILVVSMNAALCLTNFQLVGVLSQRMDVFEVKLLYAGLLAREMEM